MKKKNNTKELLDEQKDWLHTLEHEKAETSIWYETRIDAAKKKIKVLKEELNGQRKRK